jgi:cytidine deaminase
MAIVNNSLRVVTFQEICSGDYPSHFAQSVAFANEARKRALNDVVGLVSVGVAIWIAQEETVFFIPGFNVEEDTIQDCTCGEHCGLMAAYSQGYVRSCVGITIVSEKVVEPRKRIITPCIGCRGRLQRAVRRAGISEAEFTVIMAISTFEEDTIIVVSLERLLQDPRLRYTREGVDASNLQESG